MPLAPPVTIATFPRMSMVFSGWPGVSARGACVPSHEGDSWDGARPPTGQVFRRSAVSLRSDTLFGVASYAAGVGDG